MFTLICEKHASAASPKRKTKNRTPNVEIPQLLEKIALHNCKVHFEKLCLHETVNQLKADKLVEISLYFEIQFCLCQLTVPVVANLQHTTIHQNLRISLN